MKDRDSRGTHGGGREQAIFSTPPSACGRQRVHAKPQRNRCKASPNNASSIDDFGCRSTDAFCFLVMTHMVNSAELRDGFRGSDNCPRAPRMGRGRVCEPPQQGRSAYMDMLNVHIWRSGKRKPGVRKGIFSPVTRTLPASLYDRNRVPSPDIANGRHPPRPPLVAVVSPASKVGRADSGSHMPLGFLLLGWCLSSS